MHSCSESPISGVSISPVLWNLTTPVYPETMPTALLRYEGQILVSEFNKQSFCISELVELVNYDTSLSFLLS